MKNPEFDFEEAFQLLSLVHECLYKAKRTVTPYGEEVLKGEFMMIGDFETLQAVERKLRRSFLK